MTRRDAKRPILLPMDQDDAETVSRWRYEEPYAFYNSDADPDDLADLRDPEQREGSLFSAYDERGILAGFFEFTANGSTIEIGLGLRPDLTGKGIGLGFLLAGMEFARKRFAAKDFQLSVATFNRRAIRLYEKAGFQPARTFMQDTNGGQYEFLRMSHPEKPS